MRHAGRFSTFAAAVALAGAAGLAGAALADAAGARINTSRSIPVGLYWVSGAAVEKGAYVLVCPPPGAVFDEARRRGYLGAGFCPGGYGYLMKRLVAVRGDEVAVSDAGVWVNGELLPASAPRAADGAGRGLPRWRTELTPLGEAEVLLMADARRTSFDARYFGPLPRAQIEAVLVPVLTW
jgi:conjugative transfer signal peptidase TraF